MTRTIYPKPDIFKRRKSVLDKIVSVAQRSWVHAPLQVTLASAVILGSAFSFRSNQDPVFNDYNSIVKVVDHVTSLILTLCSLTSIYCLLNNVEPAYNFFKNLYPEGKGLFVPLIAIRKFHILRNFLLCNLVIGSLITLNASLYISTYGWYFYRGFVFRDVQFYVFNLVILLLLTFARKIELRFVEMNRLIVYDTEKYLKRNVVEAQTGDQHFYSIKNFRKVHFELCELVEKFNEMFGRILLVFILFIIANILENLTTVIEYVLLSNKDDGKRITRMYFFGLISFWILTNVGQAFLISFYGEFITREGKKTTKICFSLLNELQGVARDDNERLLKEELQLLALQSSTRMPSLSAGGFFDINFRVLGIIINTVTSYLIVITQFLLNYRNW